MRLGLALGRARVVRAGAWLYLGQRFKPGFLQSALDDVLHGRVSRPLPGERGERQRQARRLLLLF
jgi:hypothetical protein